MTEPPDIDLAYALDLVHRINAVRVAGVPVSSIRMLGQYNAWQCCQHNLFNDCKEWSRYRGKGPEKPLRPAHPWRPYLTVSLAALSTILAATSYVLRRPQVLVFGVDRGGATYDFRLTGLYQFLQEKHLSYGEIFHTYFGSVLTENMKKRKRPVLYLESLDLPYAVFSRFSQKVRAVPDSFEGFSEEEAVFVADRVAHYISSVGRSEARARMLAHLLRATGVRHLVAIDDMRNIYEVMIAAQLARVPVTLLQHGHFTKYHVGILKNPLAEGVVPAPDHYLVWSEYWKNEFIRLGGIAESAVIEVASPGGGSGAPLERTPSARIEVLVPYEIDGYKEEIKQYVEAIGECRGTHVLFKLRPDLPRARQCREYGIPEEGSEKIEVGSDSSFLARASLVVGTYTTYLYTAVEAERPVALLKTKSDFGEGMIKNGLAEALMRGPALCSEVERLAHTARAVLRDRRQHLVGENPPQLASVLERVLRERAR